MEDLIPMPAINVLDMQNSQLNSEIKIVEQGKGMPIYIENKFGYGYDQNIKTTLRIK